MGLLHGVALWTCIGDTRGLDYSSCKYACICTFIRCYSPDFVGVYTYMIYPGYGSRVLS